MEMVQSVILLGSYLWVVTPNIMRFLVSLHNWVDQRITERLTWCRNSRWEYPPIREALLEAGMEKIGEYVSRHHTSVAQYITTR